MNNAKWYAASTGNHQGLIADKAIAEHYAAKEAQAA